MKKPKSLQEFNLENSAYKKQIQELQNALAEERRLRFKDAKIKNLKEDKLMEALQKIQSMKREPGETTDTYAFNRCWNIASEALE
jgi:hypothetical protein